MRVCVGGVGTGRMVRGVPGLVAASSCVAMDEATRRRASPRQRPTAGGRTGGVKHSDPLQGGSGSLTTSHSWSQPPSVSPLPPGPHFGSFPEHRDRLLKRAALNANFLPFTRACNRFHASLNTTSPSRSRRRKSSKLDPEMSDLDKPPPPPPGRTPPSGAQPTTLRPVSNQYEEIPAYETHGVITGPPHVYGRLNSGANTLDPGPEDYDRLNTKLKPGTSGPTSGPSSTSGLEPGGEYQELGDSYDRLEAVPKSPRLPRTTPENYATFDGHHSTPPALEPSAPPDPGVPAAGGYTLAKPLHDSGIPSGPRRFNPVPDSESKVGTDEYSTMQPAVSHTPDKDGYTLAKPVPDPKVGTDGYIIATPISNTTRTTDKDWYTLAKPTSDSRPKAGENGYVLANPVPEPKQDGGHTSANPETDSGPKLDSDGYILTGPFRDSGTAGTSGEAGTSGSPGTRAPGPRYHVLELGTAQKTQEGEEEEDPDDYDRLKTKSAAISKVSAENRDDVTENDDASNNDVESDDVRVKADGIRDDVTADDVTAGEDYVAPEDVRNNKVLSGGSLVASLEKQDVQDNYEVCRPHGE